MPNCLFIGVDVALKGNQFLYIIKHETRNILTYLF